MPTVPTYGPPQATAQNLPNVQASSMASGELLGVGGRQLQQVGNNMQGFGTTMEKIAIDMQNVQNETDAKSADTGFTLQANDLQHNPNTGFMQLQGKNAVDAYPAAVKAVQETAQSSLSTIGNPAAGRIAQPIIEARAAAAIEAIGKHAGKQNSIYQVQTSESRAVASLQDGASDYANDYSFRMGMGTAYDEAQAQGKLHGWDEATTRLQAQKYSDVGYKLRYDAWRIQDPAGAFANFMQNRGEISPLARVQIGHQLFESAAPTLAAQLNAAGGAGIVPPATAAEGTSGPQPRGIRNNNPGNIMRGDTPWQGEVQGNDPRYASFETPEAGIRAMGKTLLTYQDKHGLDTVAEIVARWAPATENNTAAYAATVAKALGVKADQPLDLHDPATLTNLTGAMIQVENGRQPYSAQQIALGLAAATDPQPGAAGDAAPVVATPTASAAIGTAYRDPSIPTGNAIVDALPSDWKMHVLQLARTQASQGMAVAREQLKGKMQDAQASYLVNGFAPNPPSEAEFIQSYGQADGVARYRSFQDVAKLGQQLQQVKTLPLASLEQLREAAKPVPGDGFAGREHNYEILTKAIDTVQHARSTDPVAYALATESYGIKPMTSTDPKAIAQELTRRAGAAGQIAGDYGTPLALLTKPETKAVSAMLKAAPVETQKTYLAGMFQSIGDMGLFKQTMQSIAPDNPTLAVAGIYQAQQYRMTDNRDVADLILRGQAVLTPNKKEDGSGHEGGRSLIKMPEERMLLSDFNAQTGDAFKGKEQAADLFHQTAKAIYAARSAEEGDYSGNFDSRRWKASITLATGGIEGHNGSKIVMPYGMPYDKFQNTLATRVSDLVKTSPPVAATARDLMRLPLENVGDGRYLFRRGAGYVVDTNGRPLVVNLR